MENLAVPEDDPTPNAPVKAVFQCQLQAIDPYLAGMTDRLGGGQILGSLGEEQIVLSRPDTFSVL
jgi:hypothetical protein